MCGIIGYFNVEYAYAKAKNSIRVLKHRGKDFQVVKKLGDNAIAHVLHSVVNVVKQPFQGKGVLIANCEIYNWKEVDAKYGLKAKNDAHMIFLRLEKWGIGRIADIIQELDGVYAFMYYIQDKVYLVRDLIGEKPIWYSINEGLAFASENKVLQKNGIIDTDELNPRNILVYDIKKNKAETITRDFFSEKNEHKEKIEKLQKQIAGLVTNAVSKRIPDVKFGILFSGGIDSTVIALILTQLGVEFTCYTAALAEKGIDTGEDELAQLRDTLKSLGIPLGPKGPHQVRHYGVRPE